MTYKAIRRTLSLSKSARLTASVSVGLFLFSFSIYRATLAPSITWQHDGADGGDLIAAAYTLGIPHPTGYPLYVLLARLFTLLPWGNIAYRVNLMSAFFAAAAVSFVCLAGANLLTVEVHEGPVRAVEWNKPATLIASVTAALAFAFSPIFWSQAVIAEVYTLNAFFVALLMYLLSRCAGVSPSKSPCPFYSLAFVYGLSLGNHLSMLLLLPAGLVLILGGRLRRFLKLKTVAVASAVFLSALSVYLYLPLRAAQRPPINWGAPYTGPGFIWLVSGKLYRRFVLSLPWAYIPARTSAWSALLVQQFGWWGVFLGLIGLWFWWNKDRTFCGFLVILVATASIYAIGYNTTDSYVYLIPAFLVIALWLGKGVSWVLAALKEHPGRMARQAFLLSSCAFLLLPLLSPAGNYKALDLSSDHTASAYGTEVLRTVPAKAVILADTDPHTFALWYFHYAEGVRPDVVILNVTLLQYDWYRENIRWLYPHLTIPDLNGELMPALAFIAGNVDSHPIYLTDPDPQVQAHYRLSRRGPVYQVDRF